MSIANKYKQTDIKYYKLLFTTTENGDAGCIKCTHTIKFHFVVFFYSLFIYLERRLFISSFKSTDIPQSKYSCQFSPKYISGIYWMQFPFHSKSTLFEMSSCFFYSFSFSFPPSWEYTNSYLWRYACQFHDYWERMKNGIYIRKY